MASISYGLNRGASNQPDDINVGTQAVSTYDIELRWDATKSLTRNDIIRAVEAFVRRLEDGRATEIGNI